MLGGLLLDNEAWEKIGDVLRDEDFYRADHRAIFAAIIQLIENNQPADALTVAETLDRNGKLNEIGGPAYLGTLALNTPSAANIRRYAEIVREPRPLDGTPRGRRCKRCFKKESPAFRGALFLYPVRLELQELRFSIRE